MGVEWHSVVCEYVFKVKAETLLLSDGDCKTASVGYLLMVLWTGQSYYCWWGGGRGGIYQGHGFSEILFKYIFCTETQKMLFCTFL